MIYLKAIKQGLKISSNYKNFLTMSILSSFLTIIVSALIWYFVYKSTPSILGYTFKDMILYVTIISLLHSVLDSVFFHYKISDLIMEGGLKDLIAKPWNVIYLVLAINIGKNLIKILSFIFILLVIVAIIKISLLKILLFFVMVFLAVVFYALYSSVLGLITFWFEEPWSLSILSSLIIQTFAGRFVPLEFYPKFLKIISKILPFSYIYYLPTKFIVKSVSHEELVKGISILTFYIVAVFLIFKFLEKKMYKKLKIYSG